MKVPHNVGANCEICINFLKKDWKAELGIKHVLLTIKCLLIHPKLAPNEEAGHLLLDNYEEYAARAYLLTEIHAQPSSLPGANKDPADPCSSSAAALAAGGEGPTAKKHASNRGKKQLAEKKMNKKWALRRL
ncbi:ubiquitin-conjugating enzyme E2 S [Lepidochelys kempii]|uniref:ubiquitin-conjugating enzyme E2 S n=1 Tax=Lepidochelys kempii TaxID=8472 RepID=UPI003C6F6C71